MRFYFSGLVHPERALLTIEDVHTSFSDPGGQFQAAVKFNIIKNQISGIIDWVGKPQDFYSLRNIVRSSVELVVNVIGFLKGWTYDVEIVKIFDSDFSSVKIFGTEIPALEQRNKNKDLHEVERIFELCLDADGVFLRRSISDLNLAMKYPSDTGHYCFRAVESLKQYFGYKLQLDEDSAQWAQLARVTGKNKEDVDLVRQFAFPARHGVPLSITDEERKEIFLMTWDIVDAFIDWNLQKNAVTN